MIRLTRRDGQNNRAENIQRGGRRWENEERRVIKKLAGQGYFLGRFEDCRSCISGEFGS